MDEVMTSVGPVHDQERESYEEPSGGYDVPTGERRRRERPKKPPVPVLPNGTWVQIGDSSRSSTLRGQVGTVVAWGRQVEVRMRDDDPKGPTRKINPTDLVALSEEPKQAVDDSGGDSLGVENLKLARENESYDGPAETRRRERVKKPPVPVLPDGTWVQIGDSCRSPTLQGQVGTVVAWGRQVEVLLRGPDGAEGAVRKINPTDLVALSKEPAFTAAEEADDRSIRDSGDTTSSEF